MEEGNLLSIGFFPFELLFHADRKNLIYKHNQILLKKMINIDNKGTTYKQKNLRRGKRKKSLNFHFRSKIMRGINIENKVNNSLLTCLIHLIKRFLKRL